MLVRGRDVVDAVECKWDATAFDASALAAFRALHPTGRDYLVCPLTGPVYARRFGSVEVTVCTPAGIGATTTDEPARVIRAAQRSRTRR